MQKKVYMQIFSMMPYKWPADSPPKFDTALLNSNQI